MKQISVLAFALFFLCITPSVGLAQSQSSQNKRTMSVQEVIPLLEQDQKDTKELMDFLQRTKLNEIKKAFVVLSLQYTQLCNLLDALKRIPKDSAIKIDRPARWTQRVQDDTEWTMSVVTIWYSNKD